MADFALSPSTQTVAPGVNATINVTVNSDTPYSSGLFSDGGSGGTFTPVSVAPGTIDFSFTYSNPVNGTYTPSLQLFGGWGSHTHTCTVIVGTPVDVVTDGPPGSDDVTLVLYLSDSGGPDSIALIKTIVESSLPDESLYEPRILNENPPGIDFLPLVGPVGMVTEDALGGDLLIRNLMTLTLTDSAFGGDTAAIPPVFLLAEYLPPGGVTPDAVTIDRPCSDSPCLDDIVIEIANNVTFHYASDIVRYGCGTGDFSGHVIIPDTTPLYVAGFVSRTFTFTWPSNDYILTKIEAKHRVPLGYTRACFGGSPFGPVIYDSVTAFGGAHPDPAYNSPRNTFLIDGIAAASSFFSPSNPNPGDLVSIQITVRSQPDRISHFNDYCPYVTHPNEADDTLYTPPRIAPSGGQGWGGSVSAYSDPINTIPSFGYTFDPLYFNFDDIWDCFALTFTKKCLKPVINIGTGDCVTLCYSGVRFNAGGYNNLPNWVKDGDKSWVILDKNGQIINSSKSLTGFPTAMISTNGCQEVTICADCSHVALNSLPLGTVVSVDGPYVWQYLYYVGDRGQGLEYDVYTCSPFNIVVDQVCPDVGGGPPPPDTSDDHVLFSADTSNGVLNVAWVSDGWPGKLKTKTHNMPIFYIGNSSQGWQDTIEIESSKTVYECGIIYLANGRLLLDYNLGGVFKQRYSNNFNNGVMTDWSPVASTVSPKDSSVGRGQNQSWRFLCEGDGAGSIYFQQCRDNHGDVFTTTTTAISGIARGPLCGGSYLKNHYGLLYTKNSDSRVYFITSDSGLTWSGVGVYTGFNGRMCGSCTHPLGSIIAVVQNISTKDVSSIRSDDNGMTWTSTSSLGINPNIPPQIVCIYDMCYILYIDSDNPKFLASSDAGLTWA